MPRRSVAQLEGELAAVRAALDAAQTVLRAINEGHGDAQAVLDTIVDRAGGLLGARSVTLQLRFGDATRAVAWYGRPGVERPSAWSLATPGEPVPATAGTLSGRAMAERRPVVENDLSAVVATEYPDLHAFHLRVGRHPVNSASVVCPLVQRGSPVGVLTVIRDKGHPFALDEVRLLETFADQAVIAIENSRLFSELQERLAEQTATTEVLRVISQSPTDLDRVLETIAESATRVCSAYDAQILRSDGDGWLLAAHHGPVLSNPIGTRYVPSAVDPGHRRAVTYQVLHGGATVQVEDVLEHYADVPTLVERMRRAGTRTILGVPMRRGSEVVGAVMLRRTEVQPFSAKQVALLESFADQAVIAVENARLFQELQERLEEQTATSEVLHAISASPGNLSAVLDVIAASARRLVGADSVYIGRVVGDDITFPTVLPADPQLANISMPLRQFHEYRGVTARALREGRTLHVLDVLAEADEYADAMAAYRTMGARTVVALPLLRDGRAIGCLSVTRSEVRAFTPQQIALLESFAHQAVIAIENSRLFAELQEGLAEQTATSEVLRVIASSPTDQTAVLNEIARAAAQLCGAPAAAIQELRGEFLVNVGHFNSDEEFGSRLPKLAELRRARGEPGRRATRGSVSGRAYLDRETVSVDDHLDEATLREFPDAREAAELGRMRSHAATPLLRRGVPVGVLFVIHTEVRPFTERQLRLLETFADQAVIAIENARLFSELNESNATLKEALEQQTATAEVLEGISRSPTDLPTVLDAIVRASARLCGALDANVWLRDGAEMVMAALAGPGSQAHYGVGHRVPIAGGNGPSYRAIREGRTVHVRDVPADPELDEATRELYSRMGVRVALSAPLLRGGATVGVIGLRRTEPEPFSEQQVRLLQTFADQAVIAVENARLFSELQERLEEQTATAEVLRAISESPTDIQPVLDAIATSAAQLCDGDVATIWRREGDQVRKVASNVDIPGMPNGIVVPIAQLAAGPAMLERRTTNVPDTAALSGAQSPASRAFAQSGGYRSYVATPLLREGEAIGMLAVARWEHRPLGDREVRLVESFAAQAVIAIENSRLFAELQERTAQLSHSVERLTALFEVGQAVGGTLDLDLVLETVVARAAELAGADSGAVYEYDAASGTFDFRATHRMSDEMVAAIRRTHVPLSANNVVGAAVLARAPIQVPDVLAEAADSTTRRVLELGGYRAVLSVPLLREDEIIGGLVVRRREAGEFDPDTVALLQTFATQSALAIQNARLFRELADKSRQLEEASRHKSEFLANMSHELRTPLNAIIGFTEVLLERYFGEVNEKQEEYLKDVLSSGQHLLSLINDILDLSKVEAGRMELEVAPFDLGHALEAGLVMVKERASKKGITLSLEVAEDVGRIEADERKVKQVLFNLLTNAVKFTPEGGKVAVSARRVLSDHLSTLDPRLSTGECVEVAVSDTGVGIAADDLGRIWEEFGQARNQAGQSEGTGLGLALVKRFVELHGGTVRVDSVVGEGTTFTLALPSQRRDGSIGLAGLPT